MLVGRTDRCIYLDEATQDKGNTTLSTNEIIEDTQSTQEEFNNGISRNVLGIGTKIENVWRRNLI